MLKTYKIEIKPSEEQKIKIHKVLGVVKYIYNFYITHNKEIYEKEKRFVSGYDFSKWLNNEFIPNNKEYSWIKEVSSKSVKQSIMNAEKAFKGFFKGKSGFPKYKKSNSNVKAYFVKESKTSCVVERHRFKVPTLGWVRLKEKGYIPVGSKVKSGTISMLADRYFISVLVEEEASKQVKREYSEGIGVDLGVKDLAIISDGRVFKNINKSKNVKKLEKKLRREQRSLSRKIEKNKGKGGVGKSLGYIR